MVYHWVRWLHAGQLYLLFFSLLFLLGICFQFIFPFPALQLTNSQKLSFPVFETTITNQSLLTCNQSALLRFPKWVENDLHYIQRGSKALLVDGLNDRAKKADVHTIYYFTNQGFSDAPSALSAQFLSVGNEPVLQLYIDGKKVDRLKMQKKDGLPSQNALPALKAMVGDKILLQVDQNVYFTSINESIVLNHEIWSQCKVLSHSEKTVEIVFYDQKGIYKKELSIPFSQENLPQMPSVQYLRYRYDNSIWISFAGAKQQMFLNENFSFRDGKWEKTKNSEKSAHLRLIAISKDEVTFSMTSAFGTKTKNYTYTVAQ